MLVAPIPRSAVLAGQLLASLPLEVISMAVLAADDRSKTRTQVLKLWAVRRSPSDLAFARAREPKISR
jgi:hypothetical protein